MNLVDLNTSCVSYSVCQGRQNASMPTAFSSSCCLVFVLQKDVVSSAEPLACEICPEVQYVMITVGDHELAYPIN